MDLLPFQDLTRLAPSCTFGALSSWNRSAKPTHVVVQARLDADDPDGQESVFKGFLDQNLAHAQVTSANQVRAALSTHLKPHVLKTCEELGKKCGD